jgi:hypothetical protein
MRVEAPQERALWEATWRLRPYYPRSNIMGRLPNCVAITGTLVTPIVGYLGNVSLVCILYQVQFVFFTKFSLYSLPSSVCILY